MSEIFEPPPLPEPTRRFQEWSRRLACLTGIPEDVFRGRWHSPSTAAELRLAQQWRNERDWKEFRKQETHAPET